MKSNSNNSKFIRITDYCLVEYIFNDVTVNNETEDYAMYLVDNQIAKIKQCYCSDKHSYPRATYYTNNVEKYTVFPYENDRFATFDEKNDIFEYNKKLIKSDLMGGDMIDYIHTNVDTVRFHFISGYTLTNFAALVFTVRNLMTDGTYNYFLSVYLNSANYADLVTYNSFPIFLTNAKFDRYVEFKIPSIKALNNEYYSAISRKDTSAAWLSREDVTKYTNETRYKGFTKNAPITISVEECSTDYTLKTEDHSYLFFNLSEHYEASISQFNEYEMVNASIEEATDGNYFTYGMRYGDGSVENFMNRLASTGDKWDIIHQIILYENDRNGEIKKTYTMTSYQEDDFDEYMTFRPVLKNAPIDTSFSIDYQARLLNENTGEQVIRTSSCMSLNVNKYGKNTVGIFGLGDVTPNKIYNRVFKSAADATELYEEQIFMDRPLREDSSNVINTKFSYPLYVDYNKVSVEPDVVLNENLTDSRIIYKQYDLRIILKPMDSYYKFTIYEEKNGVLQPKNLNFGGNGTDVKLVFDINNNSAKITVEASTEDKTIRPDKGQVMFYIDEKLASQILTSTTNDFYIVTTNYATGASNTIYTGFWLNQYQIGEYKDNLNQVMKEYSIEETRLRKIQELQSAYEKDDEIASDVHIPGYVEDGSEISPIVTMKPKSEIDNK